MAKIAFLFPGQGSQAVGMGRSLAANTEIGRARFAEADAILGRSLSTLCFEGPVDKLQRSANTQPALLVVSAIVADLLRERGIEAGAFAGHSLGEYSALHAAGAFDFATAVGLVARRGEEMSRAAEARPGAMAAIIGLEREATGAACEAAREATGGVVGVANDNCPGQLVISGEAAAVERACEEAKGRGARRALPLPVQGAFHSTLMEAAVAPMRRALEAAEIVAPTLRVVANVTAMPHGQPDDIRDLLARQITGPVRWTESIQFLAGEGFDTFVEVGQGTVLTNLVKRIEKSAATYNVQNEEDLAAVVEALGASA